MTLGCRYDREGWYSRVENNSWRSIAFNMLPKASELEREQCKPCEKGRDWHYSRLQRWQDREAKQRRRRVEWMQKLYRQARMDNDAAQDSGFPYKQPYAPPATESGAAARHQLSDHNLPMRAAASAADNDMQSIEWLMRAKSLKAGAYSLPSSFFSVSCSLIVPRAVAGRIDGSSMRQGRESSVGKPLTADGGDTDTAYDEDDLIAWAT